MSADGQFYVGLYDYATGQWIASLDASGAGSLPYPLPAGHWLGAFLYDYETTAWVEGMHVYKERWW